MGQQSAVGGGIGDVVYLDYAWVREELNKIALPPKLEKLGIMECGEDICWFKEKNNQVLGLGRYEYMIQKSPRNIQKIKNVNVPENRAITIPAEFFDVYTDQSTHPQAEFRQIERPYQVSYAEPYHFLTTKKLAESQICLMVGHDRLEQLVAAADIYIRIVEEEREKQEQQDAEQAEQEPFDSQQEAKEVDELPETPPEVSEPDDPIQGPEPGTADSLPDDDDDPHLA